MKNIYNDNQIMSPDIMDKIANEYYNQKTNQNQLEKSTCTKLNENYKLLEYINTYQNGKLPNLQKCLIQTYSLIKQFNIDDESININSPSYAKALIFKNSLDIIKDITNKYQNIMSSLEQKAINICMEILSFS